ncbi:MAG: 50S ribosomal protein L15 [Myxococcota bacterium]
MANELSNLKPCRGERRPRTRIGRGQGSGLGKTAGRGQKGAQSRSGYKHRANFEGGQMPLHRRIPKSGFKNPFALEFETINVGRLAELPAGTVVTDALLAERRLVSRIGADGVKLLGDGDLGVALHVRVTKMSRTAADKILKAGGTIEGPVPG